MRGLPAHERILSIQLSLVKRAANLTSKGQLMSFQYMPVYTGDYLRDTQHLSCSEHGIYLKFLMHCWDQKGPLPSDERKQAGICNARSGDEIEAMRRVICEFFVQMTDGWYNKRMQKEIEKAENLSRSFSEAGKKGYETRSKNIQARPMPGLSQVDARPMPGLSQVDASASTIDHRPYTNPNPIPDLSPKTNPLLTTNDRGDTWVGDSSAKTAEKSKRATRLPEDWFLPKAWGDWAMQNGKSRREVEEEADKFRDHWLAKAGKDASKLDWFATWRNWIRNSKAQFRGKPKRDDAKDIEDFINIIKGTNSERT